MWKFFKWVIAIGLLAGISWAAYRWYDAQASTVDAFSLIPSDAIYCISTDDPIETWKEIASSGTWTHLQRNSYFAALTSSANSLDSLIHENDLLFNMIGSRSLIVSAHMTNPKQYDFLFLIDLKEVSGIKFLKDYLTEFTAAGYTIKKEKYVKDDVITLHNPENNSDMFISLPGTNLLVSFTKNIVLSALDTQEDSPKMKVSARDTFTKTDAELTNSGILRLYLNYAMLPQFMTCYSDGANEYVNNISKCLLTTGLNVSMVGDLIKATGDTYVNDSIESYVKTLSLSGKGPTDIFQIAPQRTGFYLGFGFKSFPEFFANFEKNIQKDVAEYKDYKANLKQVEDYLKISLQDNFINWIGDEIALFELQSSGQGLDNETALVLKADNIEKARQDLAHIEKMIRRKTPVKFKAIEHHGYTINYLSMKGLFKVLFGKFFARYDKPYFTIINNYVIFSNHPQTLESIIDDYLNKNTLNKSESFRSFRKEFDDEGSVFVYLNTPVLFNNMKKLADASTRASMESNKEFIVCFKQFGFQLVPGPSRFKTLLAEQFVKPDEQTVIQAAVDPQIDTTVEEEDPMNTVEEADPMVLPYIYVQNLNAPSFIGYFPDSTVNFKVDLKNGFKDGSFTEYYPNGEEKMTGHFKKDKREGTWKLFDENGKMILKRKYEQDEVKD